MGNWSLEASKWNIFLFWVQFSFDNPKEIDLNFVSFFFIKLWALYFIGFLSTNGWFIDGALDCNKLTI